jgi:ornithine cyclodeaminase
MKILTIPDIQKMIKAIGFKAFNEQLLANLEEDFNRWQEFSLSPRHASQYPQGVIELMPCSDARFYSYKYVNGHPGNTRHGKLSVVAIGMLSEVASGYPLLLSEMTLLTALRTAATGALAAKYLACDNSNTLAIIGTGAQAEFQVHAFANLFPLQQLRYFDIDAQAMYKFSQNMAGAAINLQACSSIGEAIRHADIIITATAAKQHQSLFTITDISPGTHIHAMGGDCPGKTEFDNDFLQHTKVIVEYKPQSLLEGEMQQYPEDLVHAELWELVCANKPGRINKAEITFFDSVGFALEDFSILRLVYQLAQQMQLGQDLPLLPELDDPKNLFALLGNG